MKTFKNSTFCLLFYIKKTKLMKNGEAPIFLRVTINRKCVEIAIKRSILTHLWDQKKECSNGKSYQDKELNHYLDSVKARVFQIHRELESENKEVTAKRVRDRYNGRDETCKTIVGIYREHNDQCRQLIGIDFTKSTVEKFETSLSHLINFMKYQYRQEDMALSEIDNRYIKSFEVYLKTVKACQHNSSIKHLKNLKKVIRIALANSWITKDPFYNIKFNYVDTGFDFLTREELECLIKKEMPMQRLEQVRDIFAFCCYTNLEDKKQRKENHGNGLIVRNERPLMALSV